MKAIRIGTTDARSIADESWLTADEVAYTGRYVPDQMVWDSALNNVRPFNEAEVLASAKTEQQRIIRQQAASRITAKWPLWAQANCSLGIYPDATVAQCASDIAAVIAASNTAEDAIEAATTVAEVEAVTATWPTL